MGARIKSAKYIEKNNSLCQEFYFAHPKTKVLNDIYNGHYTGSQLWKLGSKEIEKLESMYNRSVKIMYDLPWETHRYLIEPLTELPHVRRILVRRFLSFLKMIKKCDKPAITQLLDVVKSDVRLTTGHNIRYINHAPGWARNSR